MKLWDTTTAVAIASEGIKNNSWLDILYSNLSNNWVFVVVLFIIALLFFSVLLLKGKLSIKLPGGTSLDIGSDDDTDNKHNIKKVDELKTLSIVKHANCPYSIDFKHVVVKTTYIVSKISEIRYMSCLLEQMNYVEEQFVNIRTMYQRIYLEKLKEKIKGDKKEQEDKYLYEDYRYYQSIIKLMIHDMESVVRASFTNNHLLSYDIQEFQTYIDLKFNVIKSLEIDFLDSMYIGDWVITRDEIFDIHRSQRNELEKIIKNVYLRAQKISLNKKKEIEDLEQELQDFLNYTLTGNEQYNKTTLR